MIHSFPGYEHTCIKENNRGLVKKRIVCGGAAFFYSVPHDNKHEGNGHVLIM